MLNKKVLLTKFKTNLKCPVCGKELYTSEDPDDTFSCSTCGGIFSSNNIQKVDTGILEVYVPLNLLVYNENIKKINSAANKSKSAYCVYDSIRGMLNIGWNIYQSKEKVYLPSDEYIRDISIQMSTYFKPVLSIAEVEDQRKQGFDNLVECIKEVLKLEPIEYDSYQEEDLYAELHTLRKMINEYRLIDKSE